MTPLIYVGFSPFRPARRLHYRRHLFHEQIPLFANINYVKNNPLIKFHVIYSEIEPKSQPGAASVGSNKQIIFEFID